MPSSARSYHVKPDATILNGHLTLIAYKWQRIGEELYIDADTLEKIKAQNKTDMARLKDVCKMWLHSIPHGTWTHVVTALERCQEPELAKKIATIHCLP